MSKFWKAGKTASSILRPSLCWINDPATHRLVQIWQMDLVRL